MLSYYIPHAAKYGHGLVWVSSGLSLVLFQFVT